jgi:hypothetical protein
MPNACIGVCDNHLFTIRVVSTCSVTHLGVSGVDDINPVLLSKSSSPRTMALVVGPEDVTNLLGSDAILQRDLNL